MRTDLRTHPKVVRMASALKADRLRVIGGLWSVWSAFDAHSTDGLLEGYTLQSIDEDLGWRGFGSAMESVGWLLESESGLQVPDFETHNGASAKRRATDSKLKQSNRSADKSANGSWTDGGQMSASDADIKRTRVREEKEKTPPTPKGDGRFPEFWSSWPASPRKGGKGECLKLWQSKGLDGEAGVILDHVKAMTATDGWSKQGGEFVPAPAVYLRGRRWDGAELFNGSQQGGHAWDGAR